MSGQDTAARVARLEAWVEVVMRTLATLGLEGLLTELDEARGADYSDVYLPPPKTPVRRVTPVPSSARDDPGRRIGLGTTPGASPLVPGVAMSCPRRCPLAAERPLPAPP
jgi:hypothetical protein